MTQRRGKNERLVKSLQRKCIRALQLHTDLAEASCDLLAQFRTGRMSSRDRRKLTLLGRQEGLAMSAYLKARTDLITALTVPAPSADERICPVLSVMT